MTELSGAHNPYQPAGPIQSPRMFFGRQACFTWLLDCLAAVPPPSWLVIQGAAGMGKSSVLWQIGHRVPDTVAWPILVDLARVPVDSPSLFYRRLAAITAAAVAPLGVRLPEGETAAFVDDGAVAFRVLALEPARAAAGEAQLVFLFDNAPSFVAAMSSGHLPPDALARLAGELAAAGVTTLFALPDRPGEDSGPLAFLAPAPRFELGPLEPGETAALLRAQKRTLIVPDVARYVQEVTAGHPQRVQRLAHALVARQQQHGLRQVAVADVVAAQRALQAAGATEPPLPAYVLADQEPWRRTVRRTTPKDTRWLAWLLLMPLALLMLWLAWQLRPGSPSAATPAGAAPAPSSTAAAPAVARLAAGAQAPAGAELDDRPAESVPTAAAASRTTSPAPTALPSVTPRPTATATAAPVALAPERRRQDDDMPMMLVPGGSFFMGSAEDDVLAGMDEKPLHLVILDPYYVDRYEISVAQYARFLNQLGGYERACDRVDCALPRIRAGYTSYLLEQDVGDGTVLYSAMTGFARYPANHVSWYGAAAYCASVGARLPTEAEWEYAARGDDGRPYPWGDDPPSPTRAVFQSRSYDELKPVDALPEGASPFGAEGMAGSVWEWTADWYDETYYADSPPMNPSGPETGLTRVVRGGAWPFNNQAERLRSANRWSLDPDFLSSTVGFRCVADP